MTLGRRVLLILYLVVGVGCVVWSAWLLFTDANRVVVVLVAGIAVLASARSVLTNLAWAISVLFWEPGRWMASLYVWLLSPHVTEDAETSLLHTQSSARELVEHVVQVGAPADREAAAKALKLLPADDQPPSAQQVRDAQAVLVGSPVVKAWKALDDIAASP